MTLKSRFRILLYLELTEATGLEEGLLPISGQTCCVNLSAAIQMECVRWY